MAKIKLNDLLQEVSGSIGCLTVRRTRHGHILTPRIRRRRRWSDKQAAQRTKLQAASRFYRFEMREPERAAFYRARARELGWPVSSYVMRGFMKHGKAFAGLHAAGAAPGGGIEGRDGADCD